MEWYFSAGPSDNKKQQQEIFISWEPPLEGWFKLNTDGSCQSGIKGMGNISAGGIIRDVKSRWIKGFSCFLGYGTSLLAELWAFFIWISIAKENRCDPLIVESDCLSAVNLINNVYDASTHHYSAIIELCSFELTKFSQFKVVHLLREGNYVADMLSSFPGQNCSDLVVFGSMPSILNVIALADRFGDHSTFNCKDN